MVAEFVDDHTQNHEICRNKRGWRNDRAGYSYQSALTIAVTE
jgi:hypothetical protein